MHLTWSSVKPIIGYIQQCGMITINQVITPHGVSCLQAMPINIENVTMIIMIIMIMRRYEDEKKKRRRNVLW